MVQSPDKSVEQNKEVNIRFLDTLGGESLTLDEVRDLRYLSTKYPEFACLRLGLLGERVPKVFDDIKADSFLGFFNRLHSNIISERFSKGTNVIEECDLELTLNLAKRLRVIALREASMLMDWHEKRVLDRDLISKYNGYLSRVRIIISGVENKFRRFTSNEALYLANGEASIIYKGLPEDSYERGRFLFGKTVTLEHSESFFKRRVDGKEKSSNVELRKVKSEITEYILSFIKGIRESDAPEEIRRFWGLDSLGAFLDIENIHISNDIIHFDIFEDSSKSKHLASSGVARLNNICFAMRYNKRIGYSNVINNGYYHVFALCNLVASIDNYLEDSEVSILSPKENPLTYFIGELGVTPLESQVIFYKYNSKEDLNNSIGAPNNGMYINPLFCLSILTWFTLSRIRYPLLTEGGKDGSIREDQKIRKFYSKWTRGLSGVFGRIGSDVGLVVKLNKEANILDAKSRVSFKAGVPDKESSASKSEEENDKTPTFEISDLNGLEIKYLTTHPDDDVPLTNYSFPEEIEGPEYELKSLIDIFPVGRSVKVWAPFNSEITNFDLFDNQDFKYVIGRDYDLQIDSRGYYSLIFKPYVSIPSSVKYNFKFKLKSEQIDVIPFTSESLTRLGSVISKLKGSGYKYVADKLTREVDQGTILTTADLERIIFQSSLYYFSELYSPETIERIGANHYPFLPPPDKDGKLVMICSHAAALMEEVFLEIFPEGDYHKTNLLRLHKSKEGSKLNTFSIVHTDLRGKIGDKSIVTDVTPAEFARNKNWFKYIKSMYIDRLIKRKHTFIKILGEVFKRGKAQRFEIIPEEQRAVLNIEYNKQYFSSLLKDSVELFTNYEIQISGTRYFKVPPIVRDVIDLLTLFEKEYPEGSSLKERLDEVKLKLNQSKEMMLSTNDDHKDNAKKYWGNASSYIEYIYDLVKKIDMSLR